MHVWEGVWDCMDVNVGMKGYDELVGNWILTFCQIGIG